MHDTKLVLVGCITEVSNPDSYSDQEERVTVSVDGAEPLYSELRLPNTYGWTLGQRVVISIVPAGPVSQIVPLCAA